MKQTIARIVAGALTSGAVLVGGFGIAHLVQAKDAAKNANAGMGAAVLSSETERQQEAQLAPTGDQLAPVDPSLDPTASISDDNDDDEGGQASLQQGNLGGQDGGDEDNGGGFGDFGGNDD